MPALVPAADIANHLGRLCPRISTTTALLRWACCALDPGDMLFKLFASHFLCLFLIFCIVLTCLFLFGSGLARWVRVRVAFVLFLASMLCSTAAVTCEVVHHWSKLCRVAAKHSTKSKLCSVAVQLRIWDDNVRDKSPNELWSSLLSLQYFFNHLVEGLIPFKLQQSTMTGRSFLPSAARTQQNTRNVANTSHISKLCWRC